MGWDYELKEEAARLKGNETLVSGVTQRRARAQSGRKGNGTRRRAGESRGDTGSARREVECLFSGTAGMGSSLSGFRDERKRGSGRS